MRALVAAALALGCVGDVVIARAASDGATRASGAVVLTGTVEAVGSERNSRSEGLFTTRAEVQIARDGRPLEGAELTLEGGGVVAAFAPTGAPGRYGATLSGYAQRYTLTVRAGGARVTQTALVGPSIHVFSAPRLEDRQPAGAPLTLAWSPTDATEARVEVGVWSATGEDTGTAVVPGSVFVAEPGMREEEHIVVRRSVVAAIDGLEGSSVRLTVTNGTEVSIE